MMKKIVILCGFMVLFPLLANATQIFEFTGETLLWDQNGLPKDVVTAKFSIEGIDSFHWISDSQEGAYNWTYNIQHDIYSVDGSTHEVQRMWGSGVVTLTDVLYFPDHSSESMWRLVDAGSGIILDALYHMDYGNFWTDPLTANGPINGFFAPIADSSVPEPATMFLFGTGLIGLAGLKLKKKA